MARRTKGNLCRGCKSSMIKSHQFGECMIKEDHAASKSYNRSAESTFDLCGAFELRRSFPKSETSSMLSEERQRRQPRIQRNSCRGPRGIKFCWTLGV